jgi:hypothetical protein
VTTVVDACGLPRNAVTSNRGDDPCWGQVGLEPTTLRLTVAAASFTAGCYDRLPSGEITGLRAFQRDRRLLWFAAIF